MRTIRTFAAAVIGATALALAAPHLAAQSPAAERQRGAPQGTPAPLPPLEQRAERDPDLDPRAEIERLRPGRPVFRLGQDYWLRAGESVRDVRSVFGDVVIEGRVANDVVVVLGTLRLASTAVVDGTLVVVGGTATIEEGASVRNDFVVVAAGLNAPRTFTPGGEHVVVGPPALGEALRSLGPWFTRGLLLGRLIVPDLAWIWVVVGVAFLISLLVNTLFDGTVRSTADMIVHRPLSAFLIGLLVAILFAPVVAILAATVVGLVVIPFLICALVLAVIVGRVGVNRAIGYGILRPASHEGRLVGLLAFLIGFAVLVFVYMVPVIALLTWALTGVMGLGAATASFRAGLRREQPAAVTPQTVAVPPLAAEVAPGANVAAPAVVAPFPIEPMPHAPAEPVAAGALPVTPLEVSAGPPRPAATSVAGSLATYPRATFLDRVAAFVLDCVLVAIAYQVLDLWRHDGAYPLLLFAYHVAFWAWKGTTIGGIVCAVRVVRLDGQDLRFVDSVVRGLTAIFSLAALGIGCFWMLQDAERQMWHDKIAGTVVVKVPRELAVP